MLKKNKKLAKAKSAKEARKPNRLIRKWQMLTVNGFDKFGCNRRSLFELRKNRYLRAFRGNYDYYQTEGICSIGSGAVESTIKQIDRRLKISGAQWNESNVSQVLKHRCAYLNVQL